MKKLIFIAALLLAVEVVLISTPWLSHLPFMFGFVRWFQREPHSLLILAAVTLVVAPTIGFIVAKLILRTKWAIDIAEARKQRVLDLVTPPSK